MIGTVFRKEIIDHLRDRRSVLGALLLPALGPIILLFTFNIMEQLTADRTLELPVVGAEHAPQLVAHLKAAGAEITEPPAAPEAAVLETDVPLVLRIEPDYAERLAASRTAPVQLLVNSSNQRALRDVRMTEQLLNSYAEQLAMQRLIVRGVAPTIVKPLDVRELDIAPPERAATQILSIIPLLLVLVSFIGGMNIAIDATAGERERRSLEPLLLNPVSRLRLLLGKWLATSLFAVTILTIATAGFVVTVHFTDTSELAMTVSFGLRQALPALGILIPLAVLAAALQMLVATFARTFKEAQTHLSVVSLIPIIPALYLMLNPSGAETWMMLIPAMGQVATIADLVGGQPPSLLHVALIWASSAAYCAISLALLTRLLSREEIVFGR